MAASAAVPVTSASPAHRLGMSPTPVVERETRGPNYEQLPPEPLREDHGVGAQQRESPLPNGVSSVNFYSPGGVSPAVGNGTSNSAAVTDHQPRQLPVDGTAASPPTLPLERTGPRTSVLEITGSARDDTQAQWRVSDVAATISPPPPFLSAPPGSPSLPDQDPRPPSSSGSAAGISPEWTQVSEARQLRQQLELQEARALTEAPPPFTFVGWYPPSVDRPRDELKRLGGAQESIYIKVNALLVDNEFQDVRQVLSWGAASGRITTVIARDCQGSHLDQSVGGSHRGKVHFLHALFTAGQTVRGQGAVRLLIEDWDRVCRGSDEGDDEIWRLGGMFGCAGVCEGQQPIRRDCSVCVRGSATGTEAEIDEVIGLAVAVKTVKIYHRVIGQIVAVVMRNDAFHAGTKGKGRSTAATTTTSGTEQVDELRLKAMRVAKAEARDGEDPGVLLEVSVAGDEQRVLHQTPTGSIIVDTKAQHEAQTIAAAIIAELEMKKVEELRARTEDLRTELNAVRMIEVRNSDWRVLLARYAEEGKAVDVLQALYKSTIFEGRMRKRVFKSDAWVCTGKNKKQDPLQTLVGASSSQLPGEAVVINVDAGLDNGWNMKGGEPATADGFNGYKHDTEIELMAKQLFLHLVSYTAMEGMEPLFAFGAPSHYEAVWKHKLIGDFEEVVKDIGISRVQVKQEEPGHSMKAPTTILQNLDLSYLDGTKDQRSQLQKEGAGLGLREDQWSPGLRRAIVDGIRSKGVGDGRDRGDPGETMELRKLTKEQGAQSKKVRMCWRRNESDVQDACGSGYKFFLAAAYTAYTKPRFADQEPPKEFEAGDLADATYDFAGLELDPLPPEVQEGDHLSDYEPSMPGDGEELSAKKITAKDSGSWLWDDDAEAEEQQKKDELEDESGEGNAGIPMDHLYVAKPLKGKSGKQMDEAGELEGAASEVGLVPETSLPNKWPHNLVLERDVREEKACCKSIHLQSGLPCDFHTYSYPYACLSLSFDRASHSDKAKSQWEVLTKAPFEGIRACFGQLSYYRKKGPSTRALDPNLQPGLNFGVEGPPVFPVANANHRALVEGAAEGELPDIPLQEMP
ncbi:kptA [Symbiodinium sp. CCMP2592]|nr:kptA [Symbiodinium sp. CCMP2592]